MASVAGAVGDSASLDLLPAALLVTILTKLDVSSICSVASTCTAFRSMAPQILSFVPSFHLIEIAPSIHMLRPLLRPNWRLRSLKVDCRHLDDSAIATLLQPSLHELALLHCSDFSGKLMSEIGAVCKELRTLCLGSVAENRKPAVHSSDLEELLGGCIQLEELVLMFDISLFLRPCFSGLWTLASEKLTSIEIGYVSSITMTELLKTKTGSDQANKTRRSILPGIQKLCLSVDYITDSLVTAISEVLISLSHLDLRDSPIKEPSLPLDLTNNGLQQINRHGRFKFLSLIRTQLFICTCFKRVNDIGLVLMANSCANMESISLGGFFNVTDTGLKTILHACPKLYKLRVSHGDKLTDLVFHNISASTPSLSHVRLRWCGHLTHKAVANLVSNKDLKVLDLQCFKNLDDEALRTIGSIPKLKALLLDFSGITDAGLLFLRPRVVQSLVTLSLRGCEKLTDNGISALFEDLLITELRELDLSYVFNLSDNAVLSLAKCRIPLVELRLRECELIGDTSVMALASMQVDKNLQVLDLYCCGGLTQLALRWLERPNFPRLRWLGMPGTTHRDMADALARSRPFLNVLCRGEDYRAEKWDTAEGLSALSCYDEYE